MAPVMARAQVATGVTSMQKGEMLSCLTTLYDLITAIQAVVDPADDALVGATVVHLLRSGRLTWLGQASERLGQAQHAAMWARGRPTDRCGDLLVHGATLGAHAQRGSHR